jgi:carbamoyl-phosphate synthase large subunit
MGQKYRFTEEARELVARGLRLFATRGTAGILHEEGIPCDVLGKDEGQDDLPSALERMRAGDIDLVVNIPREYDPRGRPDGHRIRRAAIDLEIPLITDLPLARRVVRALCTHRLEDLAIEPWHAYVT